MPRGAVATGFGALQSAKLDEAWRADLPGSGVPHVLIGLPSYSVDRSLYDHYGARVPPLENRFVYAVLRARESSTRVVFLSSLPVAGEVLEGYLELLEPSVTRADVLSRCHLLSPEDTSPRPLAEKLLDRGDLIDELRSLPGGQPALIEPWNVTDAEAAFAVAIGAPMHGSPPEVRDVATKSNGRRLLRSAGVPVPEGIEDVRSVADVARAITLLTGRQPGLHEVVVKLDDSCAGDGNAVLPVAGVLGNGTSPEQAVSELLPAWFIDVLRRGGVVEERVVGDEVRSPSGQGTITPAGEVIVLSTHEQRLGGANGQVYEGCSFPGDPAYAAALGAHVRRTGQRLAETGACGRYAVDFVARRSGSSWELFALEINLRKGGTTHPYGLTRHLAGGRYDEAAGTYLDERGAPVHYGATDNLVDPRWRDCTPAGVRRSIATAGLAYDRHTGEGLVLHLLDCLAVDGRLGYTAIARSSERVAELEQRLTEVTPA